MPENNFNSAVSQEEVNALVEAQGEVEIIEEEGAPVSEVIEETSTEEDTTTEDAKTNDEATTENNDGKTEGETEPDTEPGNDADIEEGDGDDGQVKAEEDTDTTPSFSNEDINKYISENTDYDSFDALVEKTKAPDVDAVISEKTGGKFTSVDDLVAETNKDPFANDRIKKLNDLASSGVDIDEVLRFESLNLDNLDYKSEADAREILKTSMQLEDEDLTDRQIDLLLADKYKTTLNEDEDNHDQIELHKLSLRRDAKKALAELNKKKEDLTLPKDTGREDTEKRQKQVEEMQTRWKSEVDKSFEGYKSEKFSIDKDNNYEFKFNQDSLSKVKETMYDPNKLFDRYIDSNGKTDTEKYRREMAILENWNEIISAISAQAKSVGAEQVAKGLKNPSKRNESVTTKPKKETIEEQIRKQWV